MAPILFELKNNVGIITLNRPEKFNSFNREMALLLQQTLDDCEKNNEVILAADLLGVSSLVAVLNNPANHLQHDEHAEKSRIAALGEEDCHFQECLADHDEHEPAEPLREMVPVEAAFSLKPGNLHHEHRGEADDRPDAEDRCVPGVRQQCRREQEH